MDILRVTLFGHFTVSLGSPLLERQIKLSYSLGALLAMLVLARGKCVMRNVLSRQLWPEDEGDIASGRLNTAIWRLRKLVEPMPVNSGTVIKTNSRGDIGFNFDGPCWVDISVFENQLRRLLAQPIHKLDKTEISELHGVLELYSADVLANYKEIWALRERENMRRLYLGALIRLMKHACDQR